jgi:hypothetical protein
MWIARVTGKLGYQELAEFESLAVRVSQQKLITASNIAIRRAAVQLEKTYNAVDESRVEDQPRRIIGDLRLPPRLNLALQRLEVPLNPVHADRECINQVEALGVLGQDRCEHPRDNVS